MQSFCVLKYSLNKYNLWLKFLARCLFNSIHSAVIGWIKVQILENSSVLKKEKQATPAKPHEIPQKRATPTGTVVVIAVELRLS